MSKTIAIAAAALLLTGCQKAKMQDSSPNKVPTEDVELKWKEGSQDNWKVKLNGGAETEPKNAKTTLAQGADPTMFVVYISGNENVTFKDPGGLSVWEGAKSSPQPGINSTQIIGPIVTNKGKTLVFFDLNRGNKVTLNYELHFNNGFPSVDPIIENNP